MGPRAGDALTTSVAAQRKCIPPGPQTHQRRLTSMVCVSVRIVNTRPPEAAQSASSAMTRLLTGRTPNCITS